MADKGDSTRIMPALDPEALARAERAVAALGDGFMERLKIELVEIRAHADGLAQTPDAQNSASVATILAFAHDLSGQGGTFGYSLLSEAGNSLTHFLEQRKGCLRKGDADVLHAHLDAAAAIISYEMSGDGDVTSRALICRLDDLVQKRLTGQS